MGVCLPWHKQQGNGLWHCGCCVQRHSRRCPRKREGKGISEMIHLKIMLKISESHLKFYVFRQTLHMNLLVLGIFFSVHPGRFTAGSPENTHQMHWKEVTAETASFSFKQIPCGLDEKPTLKKNRDQRKHSYQLKILRFMKSMEADFMMISHQRWNSVQLGCCWHQPELKLWNGVTDYYLKQVSKGFFFGQSSIWSLCWYISILQGDVAVEYDIKHFVG